MKLIRNSLIAFLLLMALYEMLTRYKYSALPFQGTENQWIGNYIIAQEYIYDHADIPVVIVGSSLSTRLRPDLLPQETFNLSFNGLSPFDGINVVLGANTRPQAVFIEANLLTRNSDPDFDNGMLNLRFLEARRWMISLRDLARPVTLARNYLRTQIDRMWSFVAGPPAREVQAASSKADANVIFDRLLAGQKRSYAAAPSKDAQAKLIAELSADITALEQRGIRVVFFELPLNPALCDTPLETGIRNLIRTQFPTEPYFRIGDCNAVTTGDGVHLTWLEAGPVTRQFAEIVRQTIH